MDKKYRLVIPEMIKAKHSWVKEAIYNQWPDADEMVFTKALENIPPLED